MPVIEKVHLDNNSFLLAHASPQGDISKYLSKEEIINEIDNLTAEFVLVGHTHIQYKTNVRSTLIVNPGSLGLAREGNHKHAMQFMKTVLYRFTVLNTMFKKQFRI